MKATRSKRDVLKLASAYLFYFLYKWDGSRSVNISFPPVLIHLLAHILLQKVYLCKIYYSFTQEITRLKACYLGNIYRTLLSDLLIYFAVTFSRMCCFY